MRERNTDRLADAEAILSTYERMVARLPDGNPCGAWDNMLDGRDILEEYRYLLSPGDLRRLEAADNRLRKYGAAVHRFIDTGYRERINPPRSNWWWWVGEEDR